MGVKNSKDHHHNLKSDNSNNNITNNNTSNNNNNKNNNNSQNSKSRNNSNNNKKSQNNHTNNDDSNDSLIINNNNGNKNNSNNNQCVNNCPHQTNNNTRKLRAKDQINYSFRPNDMMPAVQQVFGYPSPVNNMFASMRARDPRMMSPPGAGYYKTKPSRIQVDPNDPLLISTLPPHLTSVINSHLPPPPPPIQIPPPPPPPPPQVIPDSPPKEKYSNTYNTAKMSRSKLDLDMTGIDRNFTDPWRNLLKTQQNIKSEKPTKSAMLQELLECPICMNRYDNPHVLPCQHTFCKNCIVTLKSDSRNNENCISCPICRETHILTNGVDGLPANYTMKRLIELEAMAAAEKAALAEAETKMKQSKAAKNLKLGSKQPNKSPNSSLTSLQSITITTNSNRRSGGGGKYQRHQDLISALSVPVECELKRTRLKLILLCHSSAIETQSDNPSDDSIQNDEEIYEDEYGKCKTFSKIGVWVTDRIEKLKEIIQVKFEIPYDEQLLVYKDKILRNDAKHLYQYRIRNYSRIHVFDKRDVKENLNELENDPYYVDQEFIEELTNTSNSKNHSKYSKYNTKNTTYIERTPRRQESSYYDDNTVRSGHRTTTSTRIILNNTNLNSHNGTSKMYQSIGKRRIRKINELFDPPEVVY